MIFKHSYCFLATHDDTPDTEGDENITSAAAEEDPLAKMKGEVESLKTQLAETQDRMLRVAADGENTRKRLEKEKMDVRLYAIQDFAKDLLPLIDAFEKALANTRQETETVEGDSEPAAATSHQTLVEGIQLVAKIFHDALKKHGVERLPGKGSPFNPSFHNAIAKVTDSTVEKETVIDEFIAGYKIGDRVLRTAMVRVATPD